MSDKQSAIKKSQQRNLVIVVTVVLSLTLGVYWLIADDAKRVRKKDDIMNIAFDGPLNKVDENDVFLERIQNRLNESQQYRDKLQKKLQELQLTSLSTVQQRQQQEQSLTALKSELATLKNKLEEVKASQSSVKTSNTTTQPSTNSLGPRLFPKPDTSISPRQERLINRAQLVTGIRDDQLSLSTKPVARHKDKHNYVPAGTFIKAVMLGGADAAASPTSQTNPTPMLFRLTGKGTLPNGSKSHLKNCVVTAAVIGDISAERGLIRTERLSCTRPNGRIIDVAVKGTVFGPSGKNGVRGEPLWREQALLTRAAVAGTLGGISDGLSQSFTTQSISPLGSTKSVNTSKIFQYGAARGASSALDKLAEYNIKRAEQYHPVIQLGAGTLVDIVILKGFYLDEAESQIEQKLVNAPDDSPTSTWQQAQHEANSLLARLPNHA